MMHPTFLCVHANQELYGSDRVFLQTLRALRKQWPDARITALLPGNGPLMKAALEVTGDVRIDDLFVLRRSRLKTLVGELPSLFSRLLTARRWVQQYDVTYISTVVLLDFILATRFTRSKVVIHVHELPTGAARVAFSLLLRFSNAFLVFISNECKRSFLGLSNKSQKVIWNGTRSLNVAPVTNFSPEFHVLLIGRFNAWKGQILLIDAIALLTPQQRKNIKVRLVGDVYEGQAHFYENIISRISEHSLEDVIEVLPFDPDPEKHYAWADVVAVPSTQPEPFGLVAIEAMSAGRAVLAANHGGLSEIVVDGSSGQLLPPGNASVWRDAIARYLLDRNLAIRHGFAGRQRFNEHFDEAIYLRKIAATISNDLGLSPCD